MSKRESITRVIHQPSTPPALRARLEAVAAIRDFASRELGLPDNGSYRSYADVGRRFVVWNVFAAPEFSVAPRQECFPFTGCVSYRGFFSEQDARRHAERLKTEGYDVHVGGVPAYSTLGWFDDPLPNDAKVALPPCALVQATNSSRVWTGSFGLTTRICGLTANSETATKSRSHW